MIKDFQGQVKVADIQAAFDEIVNRINAQVDIYNNAAGLGNIDYTKGSPKLANAGYTLSIGGLKSVISAYNGTLIGCKVYRLSDTSVLVSDGIYFKDGQAYRINSTILVADEGWDVSDLYYDIDQETVMFKNGSTSDIIEVQTGWTQPTITSNTSCGVFTANYNSSSAYNVTNSTGWSMNYMSMVGGQVANPQIVWNLPKTIKCSNISFSSNVSNIGGDGNIVVYINNNLIYTGSATGSHSIPLNNADLDSINIGDVVRGGIAFSVNISNLLITGNSNSYAYESGGVITPSDNIIKIAHLNWEAGDLILNSIEGFQLEGFKDVKLTSQNRSVNAYGQGWESIDTSNSPKFVTYTTRLATGRQNIWGSTSFLGKTINNAVDYGDSPYRGHWIATALSLIFIPKGFNIIDGGSGYCGRFVYSAKISR